MSAISPAEPRPRPQPSVKRDGLAKPNRDRPSLGLLVIDATLLSFFLALTFLLGVFPLKDADYFWHLRTGDLIRKTGEIPRVDFYTFTRQGTPWIDLHWIFQVGISWLNQHGGVPALTLAKCAITSSGGLAPDHRAASLVACLGDGSGLAARAPGAFGSDVRAARDAQLAVSLDLSRRALPLGPVPSAGLAASLRAGGLGEFSGTLRAGTCLARLRARRRRTSRVGPFPRSGNDGGRSSYRPARSPDWLAWLNPYGIRGAIYPLELAGTMSNPIFSRSIAELTPIPAFIKKAGFTNLPLQLHLFTMALGALSFVVPVCWLAWTRLKRRGAGDEPEPASAKKASRVARKGKARKGR